MNTWGFHINNVRPLSAKYSHDENVQLKTEVNHTLEGISLYLPNVLSGIEDVTYNNYNPLYLSEAKDSNSVLNLKAKKTDFPCFRTTYLKSRDNDVFVVVDGSTGTTAVTGTSAGIGNNYFFEIELLDPIYCAVRHTFDNTLKYLTVTPENSSALTFTPRDSGDTPLTYVPLDQWTPQADRQLFKYVLDETNNTLSLFATVSTTGTSSHAMIIQNDQSEGTVLSAIDIPSTTSLYTSGNKFTIRDPNTVSDVFDLQTTWNSYASSVNDNHYNVDTSKTIQKIENSYITTSTTNNISYSSHQITADLFPLKNQLTIEGGVSRNNPFASTENETTHRRYQKLHTGTFEEHGNDNIFLSYGSGVKELLILPDKLTYFHMPQVMAPYTKLSVHDTTLLKAGAIAGDTPIKSDKVFKKRSESVNNPANTLVPEFDELNGLWLCSWLSGAPNSTSDPVWVDRYYNPSFYTRTSALTSGVLDPVTYVDSFEALTRKIGASGYNVTIYDKMSDLTFEPGNLYAYHHVGPGNSRRGIDTLKEKLLAHNLEIYRDHKLVDLVPEAEKGATHMMPDGTVHTQSYHSSESIELPLIYKFNADAFGIMNSVKQSGSFTVSFWAYNDDWNKPFGEQFLGNHLTKGFGFFNQPHVTPFIATPDNDKVHIYNSDFVYLYTHFLGKTITLFNKRGQTENYWIVDNNNDIYEYDINGTIQNKITSSHLTNKVLTDLEITDTHLYILIQPEGANSDSAQYFKYNIGNQSSSYVGELATTNIWNHGTGTTVLSTSNIHAVKSGLSASEGVVVCIQEGLSGAGSSATKSHPISGTVIFGSGSTVDNDGSPWTIQNNKVYTYDRTTSSNILALSSASIIESIACDRFNDIWILHSYNKITKLHNNRQHVFTKTLSSLSGVMYNRFIDFVSEFNPGGYKTYCITINQSVSGAQFTRMGLSGEDVMFTSALTGKASLDTGITFFQTSTLSGWRSSTGYDYIRKNKREDRPRIEARLGVSNIYNPSTTTATYSAFTLMYVTSALKPGWHHFATTLDAEKGKLDLYVNTVLVDSAVVPQGRFSYSDIFDQPLTVGSAPFYTKLVLSEHLKQPQHYLACNTSLKDIRLYNTALNYYDIKLLYIINTDVTPLKWDIPTGQRNYMETIERTFRHRVPGRRSELFNINIRNTKITDDRLRSDIEQEILKAIDGVIPAHTAPLHISWDNNYSTSTKLVTGSVLGSTNISPTKTSQSTTQTGGQGSYGY